MSHTGIELKPHRHDSSLSAHPPRRCVRDIQPLTVEVTLVVLLLGVLMAEFLVVHALMADALRAGNTALDVLREMSGKAA